MIVNRLLRIKREKQDMRIGIRTQRSKITTRRRRKQKKT